MAEKPSDQTPHERRTEEIAHLAAVFWRKLLAESVPPFVAQSLVGSFVQTMMIRDAGGEGKKEPWE